MTSPIPEQIPCWIYRSSRKQEMYLYLARDGAFEELPDSLMKGFGTPHFVMQIDLHEGRSLAREDVGEVMRNLHERGFHLQMPPRLEPELYEGDQGF